MRKYVLATLILLAGYTVSAQKKIAARDAAKHLDETVMIADKVYSTKLIEGTNMVLLDLGGTHPNQYLTVVIKGEDRSKFNAKPQEYYRGRDVIVTGKLIEYKGRPEIIVSSPVQLKLSMTDTPIPKKAQTRP